jgi:RNA polymerase sigma factor (sigma-70 family)
VIGAAAAIGTEEASGFWRQAYEAHGPAVLAFLPSRARSREDAEDLLQETFVRAIRAGGGLRDSGRIRPYLFTIPHNLLRNVRRRNVSSPLVQSPHAVEPEASDGAGAEHRGRLVFDLDEAQGWEMLNGSAGDVEYSIPLERELRALRCISGLAVAVTPTLSSPAPAPRTAGCGPRSACGR